MGNFTDFNFILSIYQYFTAVFHQLRQNLPVTARLVEHIHEVGVFKDVLHLAAAQKVFDILRDARGNAAPLSEPLPNLHRIGGGLFLFCLLYTSPPRCRKAPPPLWR